MPFYVGYLIRDEWTCTLLYPIKTSYFIHLSNTNISFLLRKRISRHSKVEGSFRLIS